MISKSTLTDEDLLHFLSLIYKTFNKCYVPCSTSELKTKCYLDL